MGFDVNIGRSEPVIKAAANMNNDGGSGGNTGFMGQGRRKKKENNESLFAQNKDNNDSFELSSNIPKSNNNPFSQDNDSWINKFIKKII